MKTRALVEVQDFIRATLAPELPAGTRWAKLKCVGTSHVLAQVGVPRSAANGHEEWHGVPLTPYLYQSVEFDKWRVARVAELGVCDWCYGGGTWQGEACSKCKGTATEVGAP